MPVFVSRRAVHRLQIRAMTKFFLVMGALAFIAALMLAARHLIHI